MEVKVVAPSQDHIEYIAENMRASDRDELLDEAPHVALKNGLHNSSECRTVLIDGKPVMMFGINQYEDDEDIGIPWALGTNDVKRIPYRFVKGSKEVVRGWSEQYRLLTNVVALHNQISINWLKALGFWIYFDRKYDQSGITFVPFVMERKKNV